MAGLAAWALTVSATRALRAGNTYAGQNVLSAPGAVIEVLSPTVAIYCRFGHGDAVGRDLETLDEHVQLRFEIYAPAEFKTMAPDGVTPFTFDQEKSPDTIFGILWRQILRCLQYDQTVWSSLYREFAQAMGRVEFMAENFQTEKGDLIACRIYEIDVSIVAEADFGMPAANTCWDRFLNAMVAENPENATLAAIMRDAIEAPIGGPQWQTDAARMGYSLEAMTALGLGPIDGTALDPAVMTEGTMDWLDDSVEPSSTVDATIQPAETPPPGPDPDPEELVPGPQFPPRHRPGGAGQ